MNRDTLVFRLAKRSDEPAIIRMPADDELGNQREKYEDPLSEGYYVAFDKISIDTNHEPIVGEFNGEIVGTLHLIFLPSLSFQGGVRGQIESVRVEAKFRNQGIGKEMMKQSIERAGNRGVHVVQPTTHGSREDAHRFYKSLGFTESHLGMKLSLR